MVKTYKYYLVHMYFMGAKESIGMVLIVIGMAMMFVSLSTLQANPTNTIFWIGVILTAGGAGLAKFQ